jgi:hypothetical protein
VNVNQLHRELGKLIAAGHGRKPVAIDIRTFYTYDPADVNIIGIEEIVGPKFVCKTDDDGGTKWNKDDSEAGTRTVIIQGDHHEI